MRLIDDRGEAALELAIVAPVLMLLLLGVLQFGLWYHAQHVVQTAALEASRVAAAEEGTEDEGKARALDVMRAGLGSASEHPVVEVNVASESVATTIEANMRGLLPIPGLSSFGLRAKAVTYRERFRPVGESP